MMPHMEAPLVNYSERFGLPLGILGASWGLPSVTSLTVLTVSKLTRSNNQFRNYESGIVTNLLSNQIVSDD